MHIRTLANQKIPAIGARDLLPVDGILPRAYQTLRHEDASLVNRYAPLIPLECGSHPTPLTRASSLFAARKCPKVMVLKSQVCAEKGISDGHGEHPMAEDARAEQELVKFKAALNANRPPDKPVFP
jgi:hypothetical protein